LLVQTAINNLYFSVGIYGGKTFPRRLDFEIAKVCFAVNDLPLKIPQFDGVIVDQRQSTHTGRCEIERRG
jgi:hypothetical protein